MIKLLRTRMTFPRVRNSLPLAKQGSQRAVCSFTAWKHESRSPMKSVFSPLSCTKLLNTLCWKCNSAVEKGLLFCDKCFVIQRPSNEGNFFKLFGLPSVYDVDDLALSRKFRELQKVLHPDKFSLHSQEELAIAEEYSSLVNKAYSTIRNPWSRGVYLLKLSGIDFNEETVVDDPILLMKVMERNEEIAELMQVDQLDRIDKVNKKDIKSIASSVAANFKEGNLDEAKRQLIKLKYYTNIEGKIDEKKLMLGLSE